DKIDFSDIGIGYCKQPDCGKYGPATYVVKEILITDIGKRGNGVFLYQLAEVVVRTVLVAVLKSAPDNMRQNLLRAIGSGVGNQLDNLDFGSLHFDLGDGGGLQTVGEMTGWLSGEFASLPMKATNAAVALNTKALEVGPMTQMPPPLLAPPPEGFEGAVLAGKNKANLLGEKIFFSGCLAGAFIGYGAYLACTVGGNCPGLAETNPGLQKWIFGSFGLPFGLFMTVLSGTELFTGNAAIVTMAVFEGKADLQQLARSLLLSWLGNLVGAVGVARLAIMAGTMPGGATVTLAVAKTSLPFATVFVRGILCNWLVCMAVYIASMAKDTAGKAIAIWFPISAFVTLGLEHSVANMFIIPAGIFAGAKVSWTQFLLHNLLPVSLGNMFAGMFLVALPYSILFGRKK
ncbi:fdhC, partial [Symbiodinium microadriaticum]